MKHSGIEPELLNILRQQWNRILSRYEPQPLKSERAWNALLHQYQQRHRHYHNLTHVADMLMAWEAWKDHLNDPETVFWAIWFHDVIYDTRKKDNELRSAFFAIHHLNELRISSGMTLKVQHYILATRTHTSDDADPDLGFFLDFDLSVLSSKPAMYDAYARAIRKEYWWVLPMTYKKGRCAVLHRLLGRESLYHAEPFREREAQAQANLLREFQQLVR